MKKRWIFSLVIVIFAVSLASAKMLETKKPILPTAKDRQERIKARVSALDKKLDLTETQEKQITDILTRSKEDVNKILEDAGERIAAIKEKAELQVQEVLTTTQREKFNQVEEEEPDDDPTKVLKSVY